MQETCTATARNRQRRHTVILFLLFHIPLVILCWQFGPIPLWWSAEYNLFAITAWCLLCRNFWKDSANCMACSLFCTFVVWALPLLRDWFWWWPSRWASANR